MNKHTIQLITRLHYRKLKMCARHIVKGFDAEWIHRFRVEYKKLRAFVRMLAKGNSKTAHRAISPKLKKLYTLLGSVRDAQLQQRRISMAAHGASLDYYSLLQHRREAWQQAFAKALPGKVIERSKRKTAALLPHTLTQEDVQQYIRMQQAAVQTIIANGALHDESFHNIRKILKDVKYNLAAYNNAVHTPEEAEAWPGKNEDIDRLLEELGVFQDKCRAVNQLDDVADSEIQPPEQELLQTIKLRWLWDKYEEKQLVLQALSGSSAEKAVEL